MAAVFREAQRTTASHRKLAVTLRKLQEACCYEPTSVKKSTAAAAAASDFDEDDFNAELVRCVLRVMPIKKSEGVGEKTIRFIGLFLRHSIDKDNEAMGELDEDASTMPETPGTRLTTHLMRPSCRCWPPRTNLCATVRPSSSRTLSTRSMRLMTICFRSCGGAC
jgi:condensin complex subunit 3